MVQWNDSFSSMDVGMIDQTMLKPLISLCGLFYLCAIKLTLFILESLLEQQIGIRVEDEDFQKNQREQNTQDDEKKNFN